MSPPFSKTVRNVSGLGSDKWAVHIEGKRRAHAGEDVIFLSIGEPDLPPPQSILDVAKNQMRPGRLGYSSGAGENSVLEALSRHYTKQTARPISPDQFLFLPGTQTALYVAFAAIINEGDEVLLFDPYYATYEAVISAPGGIPVSVPLNPDDNFHPDLVAFEKSITPQTRAVLLNTPSNPTGAVFTQSEIAAIGKLCKKHDLWIVSDEVYASMVYGNHKFCSPFFDRDLEERTIVTSSISKSHALPGLRCGWIAASAEFCAKAVPISEAMLFGSQAFLEDATAFALDGNFPEIEAMRAAYYSRAKILVGGLDGCRNISARLPEGGMFVMVDIRTTGLSGDQFARRLLAEYKVVTMPGESFGKAGAGHVRVALTLKESKILEAVRRIRLLAESLN